MKESALITAVHRHLSPLVHTQSMTSASLTTNGTPDRYIDGPAGDLWIEYKVRDAIPKTGVVGGVAAKQGHYSPLQYEWMLRRWRNGRNVLGVIGLPNRTAVVQRTPEEWMNGSSISLAVTYKEVAQCIHAFTLP